MDNGPKIIESVRIFCEI